MTAQVRSKAKVLPKMLLSRREIAERQGVSTETIKRLEKAGLLKPLRFNSRLVRYRLADVEDYERQAEVTV